MNKRKLLFAIASALMGFGVLLSAGVMTACSWDFGKLGIGKFETNAHEISEGFTNISMKTDTADIRFLPSQDGKCKLVCYEHEKAKHTAFVENGTLTVALADNRAWYETIVGIDETEITVYLPNAEYESLTMEGNTGDVEIPDGFQFANIQIEVSTGDIDCEADVTGNLTLTVSTGDIECASLVGGALKITTTTGDIEVKNGTVDGMELSVSTGKVAVTKVECKGDFSLGVSTGKAYLEEVSCQNFTTNGDTGDLYMKSVVATGKFSITRTTGDVTFEGCDASDIVVKTSTGMVKGSLLTPKVFIPNTSTGKVELPETTSGGTCKITTSTGDIKITVG